MFNFWWNIVIEIGQLVHFLSKMLGFPGQTQNFAWEAELFYLLTWKMTYPSSFWLSRPKHIGQSDCFHSQPQSHSGFAVYFSVHRYVIYCWKAQDMCHSLNLSSKKLWKKWKFSMQVVLSAGKEIEGRGPLYFFNSMKTEECGIH